MLYFTCCRYHDSYSSYSCLSPYPYLITIYSAVSTISITDLINKPFDRRRPAQLTRPSLATTRGREEGQLSLFKAPDAAEDLPLLPGT
jgi:hypothetical protein